MRHNKSISIPDAARKQAIASIKKFAADTLELEIGDLKAGLFLDYILEEHGPTIYNQALADARAFMEERAADLEGLGFPGEYPVSTSLNASSKKHQG